MTGLLLNQSSPCHDWPPAPAAIIKQEVKLAQGPAVPVHLRLHPLLLTHTHTHVHHTTPRRCLLPLNPPHAPPPPRTLGDTVARKMFSVEYSAATPCTRSARSSLGSFACATQTGVAS